MSILTLIILSCFMLSNNNFTLNFGTDKDSPQWTAINDTVMGGRSEGKVSMKKNSLLFEGTISFDNNGGFASVRGPFKTTDLSEYTNVEIRYKTTGQSVALTLENYRPFYMPYYKKTLPNSAGKWEVITLSLMDFKAYRLGKTTGDSLSKEVLKKIIRIGFINGEKKEGSFSLEVDYISFK
jgi:NADH dehydrogenase [ubiquinone] 1 alpha subcomplex assembly factor 1